MNHGWTHANGIDPIPGASGSGFTPVVGEAYKTTNQSINDSSYTQITSWAQWTIHDAAVVDTATNGLDVETPGFYAIYAAAGWSGVGTSPVNAQIVVEVGTVASGEEFDEFSSQTFSGRNNKVSRLSAFTYIDAPKTLTVWAYHETGSARNVNPVTLKVVLLSTGTAPYWA